MVEIIEPSVRADIERRLAGLELEHEVEIILAVESGSRAWGFSSPDSDYDIRFVYRRPIADYARLFPHRDVIETPIEDLIDLNGWDLAKALQLLLKSNAVLSEWLLSPIRYRWNKAVTDELSLFADQCLQEQPLRWHYLSLARRQWSVYIEDVEQVRAKKYFYVLRPILTLRHLRLHDYRPPMMLDALIDETALDAEIVEHISQFREWKVTLSEADTIPRQAVLDHFIEAELADAQERAGKSAAVDPSLVEQGEALFARLIGA